MAKPIEVVVDKYTTYHVSVDQAWDMVRKKNATWIDNKHIRRIDRNIRVSWCVRQSGYAGPTTMQVVT